MNTSTVAVRARRNVSTEGLDDYPTPPDATNALLDWLDRHGYDLPSSTVFEPAAGRGYMADVLSKRFKSVTTMDVHDYGYPLDYVGDFTSGIFVPKADWVITNPPFKLLERFALTALEHYDKVAFLARLQILEGQQRYKNLWSVYPPFRVLIFINRVAMVQGGLAGKKYSSAVAYAWYIWDKNQSDGNKIEWIWYKK